MKAFCLLAFACFGAVWAQTAPGSAPAAPPAMPNLPDETVVAIFGDGTKLTMGWCWSTEDVEAYIVRRWPDKARPAG